MAVPSEVMEFVDSVLWEAPTHWWERSIRDKFGCPVATGAYKWAAILPSFVVKWPYPTTEASFERERESYQSLTAAQRQFVVGHRFYNPRFIVSPRVQTFRYDSEMGLYRWPVSIFGGQPISWGVMRPIEGWFNKLFGHDANIHNLGIYQNRIVALELNGHLWENTRQYMQAAENVEPMTVERALQLC